MLRHREISLLVCATLLSACTDPDKDVVRGHGLRIAVVSAADEARVDEAALGAAFDLGPSLTLMLHPRRLPRKAGLAGGDAVGDSVVRALQARHLMLGTCDPVRGANERDTPRCAAPNAGYVIRTSNVFQAAGDTLQLYLRAEAFATMNGPKPDALRFEKLYELIPRSGGGWTVVREARVE